MLADKVVAVCEWLYEALKSNGVPEDKLTLVRQGVPTRIGMPSGGGRELSNVLKVGYLGRADPVKGLDVLVQAFCRVPSEIAAELRIYATVPDPVSTTYLESIRRIARSDARISIERAVSRERVSEVLRGIDVLAVPSQCMETGPLVVMEARQVGVPTIGSRLGGIAELVEHEGNGWLVPHSDIGAWTDTIRRIAADRDKLNRMRCNLKTVRSMRDVAGEMADLYRQVLAA
jgi:glycosyltransferase involved in cell wall biosynthesis